MLCIITGIYTAASWLLWDATKQSVDLTRRSVEAAERSVAAAEEARRLAEENLGAAQQSNELAVEALEITRESNRITADGVHIAQEEAEGQRREATLQRRILERNLELAELVHQPRFVFERTMVRDPSLGVVQSLKLYNDGAPVYGIRVRKANFIRLERDVYRPEGEVLLIPIWYYVDASWRRAATGLLGELRSLGTIWEREDFSTGSHEDALRHLAEENPDWLIRLLTFVGIWWNDSPIGGGRAFFEVVDAPEFNPSPVWGPDNVFYFELKPNVGEEIITLHNNLFPLRFGEFDSREVVELGRKLRCGYEEFYSTEARELLQAPLCVKPEATRQDQAGS